MLASASTEVEEKEVSGLFENIMAILLNWGQQMTVNQHEHGCMKLMWVFSEL